MASDSSSRVLHPLRVPEENEGDNSLNSSSPEGSVVKDGVLAAVGSDVENGVISAEGSDVENGDTNLSDPSPTMGMLGDPLVSLIGQAVFSLLGLNRSPGSLVKDNLLYALVFVLVVGFSSILGGKLLVHCKMEEMASKSRVIGWTATMLAFILTMALVVV